jgi:hypothetical protein
MTTDVPLYSVHSITLYPQSKTSGRSPSVPLPISEPRFRTRQSSSRHLIVSVSRHRLDVYVTHRLAHDPEGAL